MRMKKKDPDSCTIAVLYCSSGQWQQWARKSFPGFSLLSVWALGHLCTLWPRLAKDRFSSQMEIQRQINFSSAPGTINIALHQPGSETVGFFQQTWYQRTALAGLNKWVWKSPLCYYKHMTQYFTSCLENEGNVMQGIEEKRQIAPPLLIGHVWIEGGQKFKKLLYEKHLGCR